MKSKFKAEKKQSKSRLRAEFKLRAEKEQNKADLSIKDWTQSLKSKKSNETLSSVYIHIDFKEGLHIILMIKKI